MENVTICELCPNFCRLKNGAVGACKARKNIDGKVVLLSHSRPCSIAIDPMEKKPLYHFFAGEPILSLGMAGCNLSCDNCQNESISQRNPNDLPFQHVPPHDLPALMRHHNVRHAAYTYTEPLVAYEYIFECAKAVKESGFTNTLVSAAYINETPLREILPLFDAANIDLKSIRSEFYKKNCKARLEPVLNALKIFARSHVHLEVTNLVIPGLNDTDEDLKDLALFVCNELGDETPLHFSRFFPKFRLMSVEATPLETLQRAELIAKDAGLKHVYLGNTGGTTTTACAACGKALIVREGYRLLANHVKNGACSCGKRLNGKFAN